MLISRASSRNKFLFLNLFFQNPFFFSTIKKIACGFSGIELGTQVNYYICIVIIAIIILTIFTIINIIMIIVTNITIIIISAVIIRTIIITISSTLPPPLRTLLSK